MYNNEKSPSPEAISASTVSETTLFCIEAVHSLPPCWNHDEYVFHAHVYYGTRPLKRLHTTQSSKIEGAGFYPRIIFDTWWVETLMIISLRVTALSRTLSLSSAYGFSPLLFCVARQVLCIRYLKVWEHVLCTIFSKKRVQKPFWQKMCWCCDIQWWVF